MILKLFLMLFIAPFLSFMVSSWLIGHFILRFRYDWLNESSRLTVEHHKKFDVDKENFIDKSLDDFVMAVFGLGLLFLPL